jgi:hypothetical protein
MARWPDRGDWSWIETSHREPGDEDMMPLTFVIVLLVVSGVGLLFLSIEAGRRHVAGLHLARDLARVRGPRRGGPRS